MNKIKIAFVCVHNSCRSQIAEALCKLLRGDEFEPYSAGTHLKPAINPDAVHWIKELYGIDMNQTQRPKVLSEIPEVDVVVTMGCEVDCPFLACRYREDWGLEDPSGQGEAKFKEVIAIIEDKIKKMHYNL